MFICYLWFYYVVLEYCLLRAEADFYFFFLPLTCLFSFQLLLLSKSDPSTCETFILGRETGPHNVFFSSLLFPHRQRCLSTPTNCTAVRCWPSCSRTTTVRLPLGVGIPLGQQPGLLQIMAASCLAFGIPLLVLSLSVQLLYSVKLY